MNNIKKIARTQFSKQLSKIWEFIIVSIFFEPGKFVGEKVIDLKGVVIIRNLLNVYPVKNVSRSLQHIMRVLYMQVNIEIWNIIIKIN